MEEEIDIEVGRKECIGTLGKRRPRNELDRGSDYFVYRTS
jgi:hypothetical protein